MYDNSKAICIVHPYLFASPVSEPRSDTRQSTFLVDGVLSAVP